jgi:hypothetical protein
MPMLRDAEAFRVLIPDEHVGERLLHGSSPPFFRRGRRTAGLPQLCQSQ